MTLLAALVLAAALVGAGCSGLRFLRVAQREHYLAGAASRFAYRWWTARPISLALAGIALVAAGLTGPFLWPGFVAAAVLVAGPPGLGLRGRTARLAWTRRCRTLAAVSAVLAVAPSAIAGGLGGLRVGAATAAAVAVFVPLVLDAALAGLAPVEERLAERFVRRARATVAKVRPDVVAITGSYGKTSTKGYLAHLLVSRYAVVASPRSYNNRAGLARTVNELLVPGTEVLIAEMGTYGPGEIAALCAWLPPRVAVLTAIGPVHLERFRDLDRTVSAKSEIALGAEVVVCNVDDPRLAALAERLEAGGQRVLRASAGAPVGPGVPDVVVRTTNGFVQLQVDGDLVGEVATSDGRSLPAPTNVACAVAAALALGSPAAELLARLASLPVADHRLARSTTPEGVIVLDDTFNSNPAGARLALGELARQGSSGGRRVVVTPGMVELGPLQVPENRSFAEEAAAVATDVVIVARTNRRALVEGATVARPRRDGASQRVPCETSAGAQVVVVERREQAVEWVRAELGPRDVVLYENDLPDHYP
ncbi:MAG: Mur ligase middle domain protein [Acidimicrobiaceae bacterium]|nr:Mur ligase middle domain protein [Acidimicrobiaceae bacterium]